MKQYKQRKNEKYWENKMTSKNKFRNWHQIWICMQGMEGVCRDFQPLQVHPCMVGRH